MGSISDRTASANRQWSFGVILISTLLIGQHTIVDFNWILLLVSDLFFSFLCYLPAPKRRAVWPDWMMMVVLPPPQWQMVLSPRRYLIPTYHPNQPRGRPETQGTEGRSAEKIQNKIPQIPSCPKDLHPCSFKVKPFRPHSYVMFMVKHPVCAGFSANCTNLSANKNCTIQWLKLS